MNVALQAPLRGFAAATLKTRGAPPRVLPKPMHELDAEAPEAPHAPVGELTAGERAWVTHLTARGYLTLGWRIVGRDPDGFLVATTILDCGPGATIERHCSVTHTPAGLVYQTARVPIKRPEND